MKFRLARFNTYLLLLLLGILALGCQSGKAEKKAPKKGYSLLRLHLEVNPDGTDKNSSVSVGRVSSFPVNVSKAAFVDEAHLAKASLVENPAGGFQLKIDRKSVV